MPSEQCVSPVSVDIPLEEGSSAAQLSDPRSSCMKFFFLALSLPDAAGLPCLVGKPWTPGAGPLGRFSSEARFFLDVMVLPPEGADSESMSDSLGADPAN